MINILWWNWGTIIVSCINENSKFSSCTLIIGLAGGLGILFLPLGGVLFTILWSWYWGWIIYKKGADYSKPKTINTTDQTAAKINLFDQSTS